MIIRDRVTPKVEIYLIIITYSYLLAYFFSYILYALLIIITLSLVELIKKPISSILKIILEEYLSLVIIEIVLNSYIISTIYILRINRIGKNSLKRKVLVFKVFNLFLYNRK